MTGGRVVVLGPTGRNFAAGMSGGLAFVLDEAGTFPARCNPAALPDLTTLDEADAIELRDLVAEHVARTGSPVGRRVLDSFEELLPKFVKVFPADYRRVLEQLAAEEDAVSTGGEGFVIEEEVPADG
jgi:glutamate synthase (NADPH/NADH) large chain/glutamate synthase (ferredoxin)